MEFEIKQSNIACIDCRECCNYYKSALNGYIPIAEEKNGKFEPLEGKEEFFEFLEV